MNTKAKVHENLSLQNIEDEIWKDIPDYVGYYQCSNFGRVKSLKRLSNNNRTISERIRRLVNNKGYLYVKLSVKSKDRRFRVHQLVAMAFLNHTIDGHKLVVDHINNIKTDNRLENLQIISNRLNCSKDKKNGASRYVGVGFYKRTGKFTSRIRVGKKELFLGYFDDEIEASTTYQKALRELNETGGIELNRKPYSSKYKGVHKSGNKFMAILGNLYLGTFDTELEAYNFKTIQDERKKNGDIVKTLKQQN